MALCTTTCGNRNPVSMTRANYGSEPWEMDVRWTYGCYSGGYFIGREAGRV